MIKATMRALFCPKLRKNAVGLSRRKAAIDVAKELRFERSNGRALLMSRMMKVTLAVVKVKGQSIRMPSQHATPPRLDALAQDLHHFLHKVCGTAISTKNAAVHTAAVVTLLQTGYVHKSVQLIPKIEWVQESAPGPMHVNIVKTVGCRAVSIAIRAIKAALITEGDHPRILNRFCYNAVA